MDRCACAACLSPGAALFESFGSFGSFALSGLGKNISKINQDSFLAFFPYGSFRQSQTVDKKKNKKSPSALITQFGSLRAQPGEVNYLIDVFYFFKWKRKKDWKMENGFQVIRDQRKKEQEYNCNKSNDKCFNADLAAADDDDGSARRVMMTALPCRRWLDQTRPPKNGLSSFSPFLFLFFFPSWFYFYDFFIRLIPSSPRVEERDLIDFVGDCQSESRAADKVLF